MPSSSSSSSDAADDEQPQIAMIRRLLPGSNSSATLDSETASHSSESSEDEEDEDVQQKENRQGQMTFLETLLARRMTPRSPIESASLSLTTPAIVFPRCRLCIELGEAGFDTAQDMFQNNPSLATTFLPERQLCDCQVGPDETPVHMMCLQRWIRVTGDKPCPKCRSHYSSPSHLTRASDFLDIICTHFGTEFFVSMWLLNVWLMKDLFWTMLYEWESFNFDDSPATLSWIFGNVRWSTFFFTVVPLMNIFVLQYFYLLYRAVRADLELIEFSYKRGNVEAMMLYSAQMVAQRYIQQDKFMAGRVNYGALWDCCSYCGHELTSESHLRYICDCFGFHRKCLRLIVNCDPENPTLSEPSKCPNCVVHFNLTSRPLLYAFRDALLMPKTRVRPINVWLKHLSTFEMPRREPTFTRYLFQTRLGFSKVAKFAAVLTFYLAVELAISVLQQATPADQPNSINLIEVFHYIRTAWTDFWLGQLDSPLQFDLSLIIRLVWFISEFCYLAHRDYLNDFDQRQTANQQVYSITYTVKE